MALLDHEGGAEFPYGRDTVFDALVQAIPQVGGMAIDQADRLAGRILAKAGVSLWSWGEIIPISLTEVSPGRTRVSIVSTPKTGAMFGGAFDMGKNRQNIEKLLFITSSTLGAQPVFGAASAPAEWHEDPTGRHQLRYWDGSRWTDHVSDDGEQSTDPV